MKTLITALSICSFSWISVSVSDFQTMDVQRGQEVTLQCSNKSTYNCQTFWFRLVNRTKASCISVMIGGKDNPAYCVGFKNANFEMSSNISSVFLKIKQVSLSDSGLYFCGFYTNGYPIFSEVHLNVEGSDEPHDDVDSKCDKVSDRLTDMILGSLAVFLVMVIIGLVVKNRKLQRAHKEEQNPEQTENEGYEELNYAAVTFQPQAKREKREELEPNVIYAATR